MRVPTVVCSNLPPDTPYYQCCPACHEEGSGNFYIPNKHGVLPKTTYENCCGNSWYPSGESGRDLIAYMLRDERAIRRGLKSRREPEDISLKYQRAKDDLETIFKRLKAKGM